MKTRKVSYWVTTTLLALGFDLSRAAVSHAAVGDGVAELMPPLVFLAFALASWALRPESRRVLETRRQALGGLAVDGRSQWLAS